MSGNVIHDIEARLYGGWGMYADEGTTGIVFENNLVFDAMSGSFHQHYGKENIIRNNILADGTKEQIVATRPEPHLSFTFENNIIYWASGPALTGPWDKVTFYSKNNCWWNHAGKDVVFAGRPLPEWQKLGHEEGSIIADPLFVDAARHDFRLKSDSPALRLGFRPFDFSKAGVYGETAWVKNAAAEACPELRPDTNKEPPL